MRLRLPCSNFRNHVYTRIGLADQVEIDAKCEALQVSRHGQLHYALVGVDANCEALQASWQVHLLPAQVGKEANCG